MRIRGRWRWVLAVPPALVAAFLAYSTVGVLEGAYELVENGADDPDCGTPDVQYGWAYEAINYPIQDDAALRARTRNLHDCDGQGAKADDAVVTADGVRIAGWYIPAGNGAGPEAPTVVIAHGFRATKASVLRFARGLHDEFNLVAFDMRRVGRSTGTRKTAGVLEQQDLRAVLDWVERTKHPRRIGVLGHSSGATTALAEAGDDPRVAALALDSMHTTFRRQLAARLARHHVPPPWALQTSMFGMWLRTGVDVQSIDAVETIERYGRRPLLLTHGERDHEDYPVWTQALYQQALDLGIPVELHWCPNSGHSEAAGMPPDACPDAFDRWTRDFFRRALAD